MTAQERSSAGLATWTRRLRGEVEVPELPDNLHTVEREALESAIGFTAAQARHYIATNGMHPVWDGRDRPCCFTAEVGVRGRSDAPHCFTSIMPGRATSSARSDAANTTQPGCSTFVQTPEFTSA